MTTGDISTAFLHAPITKEEEVYVTPPPEYYPNGDTLWKLKRAMYGLRTSPKAWQDHFAGQLQQCGLVRLKSDPNVYADYKHKVYVLVYVDDVFFFGPSDHVHDKIKALQEKVLLKLTGELAPGKSVTFLGRVLHHHGTYVTFASLDGYIEDILQAHDMTKCNPATTTGSDSFKRLLDGDDALTTEQHKQYRRAVGKIQWLAPLRPDICYAAKELARGLAAPTKEHQAKLKQLLRYLKGTVDYMIMIKPMTFPGPQQPFEIECYVDSDWAGCHTTRKSTSGLVLQLFGATLLTASRTQATIALSSGEAELYAIGTGVAEALYVRNFLQETQLSPNIQVTVYTDSTTGKSIATRMGASKRTKHVQLRYLYMQDLAATNVVRIKKVHTLQNPADVCTKYVSAETQQRHHDKLGIQSGSTPSLRSGVQHFIIGHILATTTVCHDDDYTSAAVQNHYRADNNAMADEPNPDDPNRYPEPDYGPNFYEGPRLPDPFYHPVLDDEGRRINYRVPYNQDEQPDRLPGQTITVATATTNPELFTTPAVGSTTPLPGYGSSNDSEDLRRQQGPGPTTMIRRMTTPVVMIRTVRTSCPTITTTRVGTMITTTDNKSPSTMMMTTVCPQSPTP